MIVISGEPPVSGVSTPVLVGALLGRPRLVPDRRCRSRCAATRTVGDVERPSTAHGEARDGDLAPRSNDVSGGRGRVAVGAAVDGALHPGGTVRTTTPFWIPPESAVYVNWMVFPVEPAETSLVGVASVPDPSAAKTVIRGDVNNGVGGVTPGDERCLANQVWAPVVDGASAPDPAGLRPVRDRHRVAGEREPRDGDGLSQRRNRPRARSHVAVVGRGRGRRAPACRHVERDRPVIHTARRGCVLELDRVAGSWRSPSTRSHSSCPTRQAKGL